MKNIISFLFTNQKVIDFLILLFLSFQCLAQNPLVQQNSFQCGATVLPNPVPLTACNAVDNYIPDINPTNTPIKEVRVNFHIMQKSLADPHNFDQNDPAHVNYLTNTLLANEVNTQIYGPGMQSASWPVSPPAPAIFDSRIRFKLMGIYYHQDPAAWTYGCGANAWCYAPVSSYLVNPNSEINVFFIEQECLHEIYLNNNLTQACQDPPCNFTMSSEIDAVGCYTPGNNYVIVGNNYLDYVNNGGSPLIFGHTLAHELGHILDLPHSFVNDPEINDIPSNDAAGWCVPTPGSCSNNVMGYNNCKCYFSPKQMGKMHRALTTGWQKKFVDCTYDPAKSEIINGTTVWEGNKLVCGDVIVKTGNTLVVECTVEMPPGGKVIVERGAILILDGGTITNAIANTMWQGIEVWGTRSASQSAAGAQGKVIMRNGATVANAMDGITTIKTDAIGNWDWNYTGGIIQCENSSFLNCWRGVQFLSYPYKYKAASYFKDCIFETNALLSNPALTPYAFASLFEIRGVKFLGCKFSTQYLQNVNLNQRGKGIVSIDAAYDVDESSSQPCSFINLCYGIDASNAKTLHTVFINKVQFNGNYRSIFLSSNPNAVITSNTFNIGYTESGWPSPPSDPYGIYFNNCKGYKVEDNEFFSTKVPNATGTIVNNASPLFNQVYRNRYHDVIKGIQHQGIMMNTPFTIQCNEFIQNLASNVDIAITSGFIGDQGFCSNSTTTPAGNTFGTCKAFINPFKHIWANAGAGGFNYSHHTDAFTAPSCTTGLITLSPCTTAYNSNNSCASNLVSPFDPAYLRQLIFSNTAIISSLQTALTKGDAQSLITAITQNQPAGQVKNSLINASPYLSDRVMIASIKQKPTPLPPGHIQQIITANSPVTSDVMTVLNSISLPKGIRDQINSMQNGTSLRQLAEEKLAILTPQTELAINDLMWQYLNDTLLSNPMDSVISFLQQRIDLNSRRSLLQAYLANGSCFNARTVFNQISSASDASFNSFSDLSISLCEQGKTIFELTTIQKQLLENLASQSINKEIATRSQSILQFVYGESFPEVIEELNVPITLTIHGTLYENSACGGSSASGDTLIMVDAIGNKVDHIRPVVTDANGDFTFNYFDVAPFIEDSVNLYAVQTRGTLPLQDVTNKTIAQWIAQSPITLTKSASPQEWTPKANFGGTARSGVVSFTIGNKGYMGTGYDGSLYQDFWEYDPSTDAWTQKATFPGTARFVAVGFYFAVGTKAYIGTGWNGSGYYDQSDFWEYDQLTNVWTQKANFGGGQRNGAVGFSIGNKGYIGTGWNITDYPVYFHQDFWEYDPSADTWTRKADLPGPGRQTATGFSIGSKGYIGLGADFSTNFQDFWEYDQASDTWSQKSNFPAAGRQWATAFAIGTKGYMGTGGTYPNGPFYSDFWEYDQATDVWAQKANFGGSARNLASGFSIGGKGYLGTGYDGSFQNDFWEFTPGSNPCMTLRSGSNEPLQPVTINTLSSISVYPNPSNGDMTISYFIPQNQKAELVIYDMSGRQVKSYFLKGERNQLSISEKDLQKGIYFYNVVSNGKLIKQDKIVVIK